MKVTVCFGEVRVLVPCGAGDLLVRDLIREASNRFKKATGQGAESWVEVRALRASSGGILDPDDVVRDVADDRETLVAECAGAARQRHHGGDGASGSSVGTASPDMFRTGSGVENTAAELGVEVTRGEEGPGGLQVRRGSEPSLNHVILPNKPILNEQTKRWSAAVVCRDDGRPQNLPAEPPPDPHIHPSLPTHITPPQQPFQRQSNRLSMQFSGPGSGNWLEAAERVQTLGTKSLPRDSRKEPLGQDTHINTHRTEDTMRWVNGVNGGKVTTVHEKPLEKVPEVGVTGSWEVAVSAGAPRAGSRGKGQLVSVSLVKGKNGLGFTITTRDNPTGGHAPIYIKNIIPKGAAVTDGRLQAGDRLVSINGTAVSGMQQQEVVSVLRNTPTNSTVNILVERAKPDAQRVEPQQSPGKFTEKAVGTPESAKPSENGRVSAIVNALNSSGRFSSADQLAEQTTQEILNTSTSTVSGLRNRRILQLDVPVHDSEKAGLGVSVKGKVTVGPESHDLGIFVKSVLHGGAASRDGRLHTNDQLLSVNGVSLVGQSNAEAMETLRRALLHSHSNVSGNISLTVARRTDSMDSLARWKDDTPPTDSSGNSTTDTQQNTVIYNTIANATQNNSKKVNNHSNMSNGLESQKSKPHASIITINNNSWNQSDDNKSIDKNKSPEHDSKRDSFEWSRLEGWNPVIDRLTGLRNESYYMATQEVNGHRYGNLRAPQHNVIFEEETNSNNKGSWAAAKGETGGVYESGSESASGTETFSRDAVTRRSMSEKRHATVDAHTTALYNKIKQQKAINAAQAVGPTLGMRKSSSLESLQTAVQEQQRQPTFTTRRHPQHTPQKHWLTDEPGGDMMVRGSPQQSSLSHKKPSLFKSLSSMLKFGNKPKKEEIYGRSAPGRASEKSLSREAMERSHAHAERKLSERNQHFSERGQSDRNLKDRAERERERAIERERNDRVHGERIYGEHERRPSDRGHLDKGYLERHDKMEPRVPELPNHRLGVSHARQGSGERAGGGGYGAYRLPPARVAPAAHTMSQMMEGAWGANGHYVNYQEIQQNLNARREKLSEVQIGQMRRTVHQQRVKVEGEGLRTGPGGGYHSQRSSNSANRPQSNYYEYETVQPHRHKLHYH